MKALFTVAEHILYPYPQFRVLPVDGLLSFADFLVPGVALTGNVHETPVYHDPLVHDQMLLLQESEELVEQLVEHLPLGQLLAEGPYRFLVGHLVAAGEPEEVPKRESVANLVFGLPIALSFSIVSSLSKRVILPCFLYVGLASFIVFQIYRKYTNNSLNDNWLQQLFIVKSSKTDT